MVNSGRVSVYDNGFTQGIVIRGVSLAQSHPGRVFWVGNSASLLPGERGASNGNKGGFLDPFLTIDAAVGACAANRGDIIFVRPNHTDTVTAAAGLDLDVAGIALIGLGSGSNRPTINFTTATTADMDVDAANITMVNFLFTGGIDALAGPIDVNAADFKLIDCEYRDVTGQATDVILADANADRLLIDGYFHNGATAAGGASAIALTGMDNPVIRNFKIDGNFSVGAIDIRTTAAVKVDISNGYIWQRNAADVAIVDTVTASTGRVGPNLFFMLTDNAANVTESVTGATFHLFDPIYVVNLAGEKAMLINTTATTDA
jgi:hypothetical protein